CSGSLQAPESATSFARLGCESLRVHEGFFLERVDPQARPFGSAKTSARIRVASAPPTPRDRYVGDFAFVDRGGKHELWAMIEAARGEDTGGIYIFDATDLAAAATRIPLVESRRFARVPDT